MYYFQMNIIFLNFTFTHDKIQNKFSLINSFCQTCLFQSAFKRANVITCCSTITDMKGHVTQRH